MQRDTRKRVGHAASTTGEQLRKLGLRVPGHCGHCGGYGKFEFTSCGVVGGEWSQRIVCGHCEGTGLSNVATFADALGIGVTPINKVSP